MISRDRALNKRQGDAKETGCFNEDKNDSAD
jgi:hypothetical protein